MTSAAMEQTLPASPAGTCGRHTAAPPQGQRRSSSRGPRRSANYSSAEIEELIKVSEIVPTACNEIAGPMLESFDPETASTAAPSSTKTSPALTCIESIEPDSSKWPSLQESCTGFDFCSAHADSEELSLDDWENLPDPAVTVEDLEFLEKQSKPTMSYADSVRHPSGSPLPVLPPAAGTRMPPIFMQLRMQPHGSNSTGEVEEEEEEEEEDDDIEFSSAHGWTKAHKGPRSKKQQRKEEGQKALRANQRSQSLGEVEFDE